MAEFDINKLVDDTLKNKPESLRRIIGNREFKKKLREFCVDPESENVSVFGVKNVNLNAILKNNLWDRSIFTTDKLCRMFLSYTLEQMKKYEKKKRVVPLNMLWIVLLMFGVIAVVMVVIFLLPHLGGMIP